MPRSRVYFTYSSPFQRYTLMRSMAGGTRSPQDGARLCVSKLCMGEEERIKSMLSFRYIERENGEYIPFAP